MTKYVIEFEDSSLNLDFIDEVQTGTYEFNLKLDEEETSKPLNFFFKLTEETLDYSQEIQRFYGNIRNNVAKSKISNIKVFYVSEEEKEYEIYNMNNYKELNLIGELTDIVYTSKNSELNSSYLMIHRIVFEFKK